MGWRRILYYECKGGSVSLPGLTLAPQHRCKNCKNKTATLRFLKLAIGDPRVLWFGIGLTLGLFLSAAVQGQEFDIEVTGQIGGSITAISGQKTRIYLGSSRLFILDASNPAQPTILGRTDLLPCPIAAIVVREDYAYVADGWGGLYIFDVSDPKRPVEVGACSTEWEAWDIALTGHYACIADGWSLRIIDVTNPTHPTEVGTWDSGSDYITVVAAEDNYVYLPGSGGRLHIIDISNPAQPTEVASWSSPSGILGLVAVKGNYAYVECDGLVVLDISDPAQPTEVGSWREADHCVAEKIIVEGSYVYLAAGSDGLCIFDVSDPTHPLKIGACGVPAYDLTVLGSHAYVSASRYESSIGRVIHIVSVSNPAQPIKIGSWNIWGFTYAFAVQVRGGYAFVGSGEDGLCIIDVSNPAQPIEVASWSRPDCSVKAIAVEGSHVYLAAGGAGLRVINVSNPAQPTEVGSWTLSPVDDIAVKGNHAYVITNDGSLHIIDVSNPAQPIEVSSWNGSGCGVEYIVGVGRSHVYVVTAELKYSLRVIDVSNPVTPAEIGSCDIPSCSGATVVEPYVYIAAGPFGLRVVDASDPTSPREVGSCDTPHYAEDVVVVYDYAYVAGTYMYSGLSGLCIMNVSSPSHPTEVGSCDMPGFALGVTISGDYAYIADGHGGLVILRCTKREPPEDTIPPALIQGFTASDGEDGQSTLRWTNPPDDDLAQVIVRRKTDGYPSDHTDGDLIYQDTSPTPGASVEHVDTGLVNGTTYYYAAFSRDAVGNWNDQVVEGKNADTAVPGTLENHPPDLPAALVQLLPDGTEIPVGGQVDTNTVVFKALVTDPDGDKVKLQVELRRLDELGGGFDKTQGGLKESEFVASGEQATCSASGLIPADYHWRARAIDEHGLAGEWVEFGNNPTSATDFTVQAVIDTTPPALVQDFSASDGEDGQSILSWTNPPDNDLAEVVVRRKTDWYPSDHTDGDLIYQDTSPTPGASVEYVDTGLTNGTTYYYAVFSRDTAGNWNDQVVEGKNADIALLAFAHVPPGGFWAEITNTPYGRWRMRAEPGLSGEVVKILPEGWVIWVLDTHDDVEERDGYIWWEVRDTTDEGCQTCTGWMAARKADGSKIYLTADPNDQSLQSILAQRAAPEAADEVDERKSLILDAIVHYYYNSESGVSLRDGGQFSRLRETLFPPDIILAIFVQESQIINFDNEWVVADYGHGVGQITWCPLVFDNRGIASGIKVFDCQYSDVKWTQVPGTSYYWPKRRYLSWRYYANTPQSIYANVKDAFALIDDAYRHFLDIRGKEPVLAMRAAVWAYNAGQERACTRVIDLDICQGAGYLKCIIEHLRDLESYFPGYRTVLYRYLTEEQVDQVQKNLENFAAISSWVEGAICSPAEIKVVDSAGRITGVVNGVIHEEIPGSVFYNHSFMVLSPEDGLCYEVVGEQNGVYDFKLISINSDSKQTVIASAVPIYSGSIHRYSIDWDALARGEEGVTLQVDADGDGEVEQTFQLGSEVDGSTLPIGEVAGELTVTEVLNYPNPCSSGTTFTYNLSQEAQVRIEIYTLAGELIKVIEPASDQVGYNEQYWDGTDDRGHMLDNGVYIYRIVAEADGKVAQAIGRLVILR